MPASAAQPLNLNAVLNLSLGSLIAGQSAQRALGQALGNAANRGFRQGMQRSSGEFEKTWTKLLQVGMRKSADELKKAHRDAARIERRSQEEIRRIQTKIRQTTDKAEKKQLIARKQALENEIKRQQTAQKKMLEKADKAAQARLDLVEAHEARMNKGRMESFKEGGETFRDLVQQGLSLDNVDPSTLAEGLVKALGGAAGAAGGAAGAAGATGALGGLAAAASTLAAVAAPIAAVVGIIAAAYGQTKELNKALLESASVGDILSSQAAPIKALGAEYGALNFRLKMLRRVSEDAAYEFRMSKEEVAGYIGALNSAGLTVKEFRGIVRDATNDMQAYQDVTRTAILASQGLGISSSETGEFMDKLVRDLGYGLDDIQGAFGMIYGEAQKSGMATKDFFAAVNQATSGMALYNFRIGDTIGLFTDLVKILGEDLAKEQIGLKGTFSNMSMQEKYKTAMLGGKGMRQAVAADAARQAEEFADALAKKGITIGGGIQNANGGIDMDRLRTMSAKDFRAQLGMLQTQDPTLARQLYTLRGASQAGAGGPGGTAGAMGSLSKLGELAAQMAQGSEMLGGKTLEEASRNPIQRMMAEEVTGMSGEQFDQLARIQTAMLAEFEQLVAMDDPKVQGKTFYQAVADGTLSQTDQLTDLAKTQYTMMERAATDQLMETRSIGQTLSNIIASLLENIWLGVEHLITLFAGWLGKDEGTAAREESIRTEQAQAKALEKMGAELAAKKTELTAENDPEKRAALLAEIKKMEGEVGTARDKMSAEQEFRRRLATGGGASAADVRRGMASDAFVEKYGMTPEEYAGKMDLKSQARALGADQVQVGVGTATGYGGVSTGASYGLDKAITDSVKSDLIWGSLTPEDAKKLGFDVALTPLEKLTTEQIEAVSAEAEKTRLKQEKEAVTQVKATQDTTDAVTQLTDLIGKEQLAKLTGATGLTPAKLQEMMGKGEAGQKEITGALQSAYSSHQISKAQFREYAGYLGLDVGSMVNDFIYRGDGQRGSITPINDKDMIGTLSDGTGPLAGMGNKIVYVNINGGDEARIYQILKKVLRDTGYADMRSY